MTAMAVVATVAGEPLPASEVDELERRMRSSELAGSLPAPATSEGRQLRRWLAQLLVAERLVAIEAARRGIDPGPAPGIDAGTAADEHELLPDPAARLEIGSVASALLSRSVQARVLFAQLTADVDVDDDEIARYHARNPYRFAAARRTAGGWDAPASEPPPLDQVRAAIAEHLRQAARRRAFVGWLDGQRAELVRLAPGYEHPGDPRQPDNTHRH